MNNERLVADVLTALSIAEAGSMNKAAKALNISQPSLTRVVALLERTLGGRLFERGAKGVRLTELGDEVMEHARAIRAHAMRLRRSVAAGRREPNVHFHFAAAPVVPLAACSLAILDLMAQMPSVRIHVAVGQPAEVIELLRKGDVEMAMLPLGEAAQHEFGCELLYYDAMAIYGRAGHPLTIARRVDIGQLGQQKWVLGFPGSLVRMRIEELFTGQGAGPPQIALEADDVALRRSLVIHSDHLSAFQVHHVYNDLRAGLIAKVPYRWSQEISAVGLLRLLPHTEVSRCLLQAFQHRFREAGMQMTLDAEATFAASSAGHGKGGRRRTGLTQRAAATNPAR